MTPSSRDVFLLYLEHVEQLYRQRLFSKAGKVVAPRRSNFKPKNVDVILFLNKNLLVFWHCAVIYYIFLFVWGRGGSIVLYGMPLPGIAHLC